MKQLTPIHGTNKLSKASNLRNIQNRHNFPRYDAIILAMYKMLQ